MEGWVLASCIFIIFLYILFRLLDYLVFLVSIDNNGRRAVQVYKEFRNDVPDIQMRNHVLLGYRDGIPYVQDSDYFNYRYSQFLSQRAGSRELHSPPEPLFPEGMDDQRLLRRNDYSSNLTSRNNSAAEASSLERFDQPRILTSTNLTRKRPSKDCFRRPNEFLVACWNCDFSQMESLIENGADPCIQTEAGETGLILCVYRMAKGKCQWNPDCLELLIDSDGRMVTGKANNSVYPSPTKFQLPSYALILECSCPIDGRTNKHSTALHFAVKAQHIKSIKWLLSKGASVTVLNDAGYLPFAIAMASGREDIAKLLSFHHLYPDSEASYDDSEYYSAKD